MLERYKKCRRKDLNLNFNGLTMIDGSGSLRST
jgi:hypothetical protein